MKKILLCVAALAVGGSTFGQEVPFLREQVATPSSFNDNRIGLREGAVIEDGTPNTTTGAEAAGDIIFSEDFGSPQGGQGLPLGWSTNVVAGPTNFQGFEHTTTGANGDFTDPMASAIASPTAANGWMMLNTDGANVPMGDVDITAYMVSSAIDVSQVNGAWFSFQSKFRFCCTVPVLTFELYSDAGLTNLLASYDFVNDVAVNNASEDPQDNNRFFLNTIGINTVYARWGWEGASHYYLMIDDFIVEEAAADELTLVNNWYNGKDDDSEYLFWYNFIPSKQMAASDFDMGGIVQNKGFNDQTNVVVNSSLAGPNSTSTATSDPIALLPSGASDSATNGMHPASMDDDLGMWTADWSLSYDGIANEFDMADNSESDTWEATANNYGRDDGNIQFISMRATNEILGVVYDFPAEDEIRGVDVYWGQNTGNGLVTVGGVVNIYLYNITQDGFDSPIPVVDFHEITAGEVTGDFSRYDVSPALTVNAGEQIMPAVEVITETSNGPWIGITTDRPAPFQVFECIDCQFGVPSGSGNWFFRNFNSMPGIRLVTAPASTLCDNINLQIISGGDICYDKNTFTAEITPITVVGGTPNYTYAWSGPAPVGGTNGPGAAGIDALGLYSVLVTDNSGCTGTFDFNVDNTDQGCSDGNVGINEAGQFGFDFDVFPNPNDGNFTLNVETATTQDYTIQVINILGEVVHTENVRVAGSLRHELNLGNLSNGIYTLTLSNDGYEMSERVVIK